MNSFVISWADGTSTPVSCDGWSSNTEGNVVHLIKNIISVDKDGKEQVDHEIVMTANFDQIKFIKRMTKEVQT
jgi:hypothetical protein